MANNTQNNQQKDDYIVSPQMLNIAGIAGIAFGVLVLVALAWHTSAQPKGRFTKVNTQQYQRTLEAAAESLAGTSSAGASTDAGKYQIPIAQAINIVANQGLQATSNQLATSGSANQNLMADVPVATWSLKDASSVQAVAATLAAPQAAPQQPAAAPAQAAPQQATTTTMEAAAPAPAQEAPAAAASAPSNADIMAALPDGSKVFNTNCASCHQATGQGIPGAFPALVGHAPKLYNASRDYLPNLILYGLQGQINVEGSSYNGVMPAWAQLSDEELAAVLNYVLTDWGNEANLQGFQAYQASDIAGARANAYSAMQVHDQLRSTLNLP